MTIEEAIKKQFSEKKKVESKIKSLTTRIENHYSEKSIEHQATL